MYSFFLSLKFFLIWKLLNFLYLSFLLYSLFLNNHLLWIRSFYLFFLLFIVLFIFDLFLFFPFLFSFPSFFSLSLISPFSGFLFWLLFWFLLKIFLIGLKLKNRNIFNNQEIDIILKSKNVNKIWQLVSTELWIETFISSK